MKTNQKLFRKLKQRPQFRKNLLNFFLENLTITGQAKFS